MFRTLKGLFAVLMFAGLFSCSVLAQTPITITEQNIYDGLDIGDAYPPAVPDYPSDVYAHESGRIELDDTGGYIYLWDWNTGLIFQNNTTAENGGAFYIGNGQYDFSAQTTLDGSPNQGGLWFQDNSATHGGAIYLDGGELTIGHKFSEEPEPGYFFPIPTAAEFRNNSASGDGGAIYNNGGILTLNGVNFRNNTAGSGKGSAIYNAGGIVNINTDAYYTYGSGRGEVVMSGLGTIIYNDGGEININVGQGGSYGWLNISGGWGTESIRFAGNSSLNIEGLGSVGTFGFAPMSAEAGANVTIKTTAASWALGWGNHDLSDAATVDFTVGADPDVWYRGTLELYRTPLRIVKTFENFRRVACVILS